MVHSHLHNTPYFFCDFICFYCRTFKLITEGFTKCVLIDIFHLLLDSVIFPYEVNYFYWRSKNTEQATRKDLPNWILASYIFNTELVHAPTTVLL